MLSHATLLSCSSRRRTSCVESRAACGVCVVADSQKMGGAPDLALRRDQSFENLLRFRRQHENVRLEDDLLFTVLLRLAYCAMIELESREDEADVMDCAEYLVVMYAPSRFDRPTEHG